MAALQEESIRSTEPKLSLAFPAEVSRKLDTGQEDTFCLCSARDGRLLTGHYSVIKIWDPSKNWSLSHSIYTAQGEVTCIAQSPVLDHCVAASVGSTVLMFDLRSSSKPVNEFSFLSEDINEVTFHPKGTYLSACDDAGDIAVIDTSKGQLYRTLTKQHENICSSVKFHPRKPWELISGGLDCRVIRWDFNRGRPLSSCSTQDAVQKVSDATSSSYLVNPPMVHSLDFVNGSFPALVCGLGNGSVAAYAFRKDKKELELLCVSQWKHSASIAHICCTGGDGELSNLVISGGNDCKVCVSRFIKEDVYQGERSAATHADCSFKLVLLNTFSHGSKVNWISVDSSSKHYLLVCVADQTQFISVYQIGQL